MEWTLGFALSDIHGLLPESFPFEGESTSAATATSKDEGSLSSGIGELFRGFVAALNKFIGAIVDLIWRKPLYFLQGIGILHA